MIDANGKPAGKVDPGSLWRDSLAAQNEFSTGFDGILLFVAINRVFSPAFAAYILYLNLQLLLQPAVRDSFNHPEYAAIYREAAVVTIIGTIGSSISLLFGLILLWLFFRRRRSFRTAILVFLFLNITLQAGILSSSILFGGFDRDALFYLGISTLWALIWVPYFLFSQRVKNTFVH